MREFLISFVAVFSGVTGIGLLCNTIVWTITLGNVVQSLATISAAIGVAYFINRRLQERSRETDLLIDWLSGIQTLLAEFESIQPGDDYARVVNLQSLIRKRFRVAASTLSRLGYNHCDRQVALVQGCLATLKVLSTDLPKTKSTDGEPSSRVENGKVFFVDERLAQINVELDKANREIFALQISINRGVECG